MYVVTSDETVGGIWVWCQIRVYILVENTVLITAIFGLDAAGKDLSWLRQLRSLYTMRRCLTLPTGEVSTLVPRALWATLGSAWALSMVPDSTNMFIHFRSTVGTRTVSGGSFMTPFTTRRLIHAYTHTHILFSSDLKVDKLDTQVRT